MDCLLCYDPGRPAGSLLGMNICHKCESMLRSTKLLGWVDGVHPVIDRGLLSWARLVHYQSMVHNVEEELWLAKRMALASLLGLEVDLVDLRHKPTLEWDTLPIYPYIGP